MMEKESVNVIGGIDGPTAVFVAEKRGKMIEKQLKKKRKWEKQLEGLAKRTVPCRHTVTETETYIKEKYHAKEKEVSLMQKKCAKYNIIENECPQVLKTKLPEISPKALEEEMEHYMRKQEERMEEAYHYPDEKIGMDLHEYVICIKNRGKRRAAVQVETERTRETVLVGYSINNDGLFPWEKFRLHKICGEIVRDISLYQGVTKEDIETKSPAFCDYALSYFRR